MGNLRRQAQEKEKLRNWYLQNSCSKKSILKKKEEMKKSAPYWNFWRVILAGWIIRYPKQMSRISLTSLGILISLIYNALVK
jgi:hypothetical protein